MIYMQEAGMNKYYIGVDSIIIDDEDLPKVSKYKWVISL